MRFLLRLPFVATMFMALSVKSYLKRVGWMRSFRQSRPVDAAGNPILWITYPCASFLAERWKSEWSVLEFGSGYSTLWFAGRGSACYSLESHAGWASEIRAALGTSSTSQVVFSDTLESAGKLLVGRSFDIVFIDGTLDRLGSFKLAVDHLSPKGFVIWDNSDREEYREGKKIAESRGFRTIDFDGPIPCSIVLSRTTILYRNENALGI